MVIFGKLLALIILRRAEQNLGLLVICFFSLDLSFIQNMMERFRFYHRTVSLSFISCICILLLTFNRLQPSIRVLLRSPKRHKKEILFTFSSSAEGMCLLLFFLFGLCFLPLLFGVVSQANNSRHHRFICGNSVFGLLSVFLTIIQLFYYSQFCSHPHLECFHFEWQAFLFHSYFRIYMVMLIGLSVRGYKIYLSYTLPIFGSTSYIPCGIQLIRKIRNSLFNRD